MATMPIAEAASVPRPYMLVPISWRPTDSVRKATNVQGLAAIAFTAPTARKPKRMPAAAASAATSSTTRTCRWPGARPRRGGGDRLCEASRGRRRRDGRRWLDDRERRRARDPVAPERLRPVEREVGLVDQVVDGVALGMRGDPERDRRGHEPVPARQLRPLLLHSDHVPLTARHALRAAYEAPLEERISTSNPPPVFSTASSTSIASTPVSWSAWPRRAPAR